jgi:choline dehydrogenase-like flavoprotein
MTLINGVRLARQLLQTPELAPYVASESMPGAGKTSDEELLGFIRQYGVSSYHLNGTARMGTADDKMAVVDGAGLARPSRRRLVSHADRTLGEHLRGDDDDRGKSFRHDPRSPTAAA